MPEKLFSRLFNNLQKRSKIIPPFPAAVWHNPLYFLAFGLGSGRSPYAPGTAGTLAAIPCYLLLSYFLSPIAYIIFTCVFIIFSSWLCERISKETATHDHPGMNIDEFAGFFVTMIAAPQGWQWIALGFILFRLFDIFKPWPISYIDKNIDNGFGMILDDVVAGLFSLAILQLTYYFLG